jgi:putative ABC transport system permease protein
MKTTALLFFRLILRPMLREPIRMTLIVIAIALGVGVVVAVDLAGNAAAGSFHSSLESLAGKSDLVLSATGGIDEHLLGKLVQLPYPLQFIPRIEAFASVNRKGEAFPFVGIDLIGNRELAAHTGSSEDVVSPLSEDSIWAGRNTGLRTGQHVTLLINDVLQQFTVAGLIPEQGELGEENIIVADIGLAQKATGKAGRLDRINVRVPPVQSLDHWRQIIRGVIPPSVTIELQGARTEENRKMLSAFRWNLHVLSYIALLVGGFLIYNTISISVVRRRSEIGIVRALGGSRRIVANGFLVEALTFAFAGTLFGLFLGRLMALGAVKLIGTTVQSLYVSSYPAPVQLNLSASLTGIVLGFGVSLLAALAPAWEASQVAPVEAMARGREQYVAAVRSRRNIAIALVMLLFGAALTQLGPIGGKPIFAYISVLLLVAGNSLAIPYLVLLSSGV